MFEAISASDFHLGAPGCQARLLGSFLDWAAKNAHRIILNGDTFDSWNFRKLKTTHWKVLQQLRELDRTHDVIWIAGNHDGDEKVAADILGLDVLAEYEMESAGKKLLFLHGHQFKRASVPRRLNRHNRTAGFRRDELLARHSERVVAGALEYARSRAYDVICCGHTHYPEVRKESPTYANSGCWTERSNAGTYLTIEGGEVQLRRFSRRP